MTSLKHTLVTFQRLWSVMAASWDSQFRIINFGMLWPDDSSEFGFLFNDRTGQVLSFSLSAGFGGKTSVQVAAVGKKMQCA
jgi:hypothetical protein